MKPLQLSIICIFIILWSNADASCYFPQEYQGEYVMQNTASVGNGIQYSTLNITENSIPIWGNCYKRIGNNFILVVNIGETSCVRCLHLKLRSSSILQVFISSEQSISQCSTNEEAAESNCPSEATLYTRNTTEILFFKTRDASGIITTKEYCPMDGKYFVNYKDQGKDRYSLNVCNGFNSTVDSCPSGSTLNFRLRSCTLDNSDIKFNCLGHWQRPGKYSENYLIFTDSRHPNGGKPLYRCGIYKTDEATGRIDMAVSSDSTCSRDLYNSTSGHETFSFQPKRENPWPADAEFSMCSFPEWMRGHWEHVRVDEKTLVYKDHSSLKTYTIKCVVEQEAGSKYVIFSRTQCDEERYNCMRIAKRSENILEFQLGANTSSNINDFTCSDENFLDDSWITQGKVDTSPEMITGMCPITGEYTGMVPDATYLCAKLWSDCRAPAKMYYQVSHCESNEVYEEREYQCLGHWNESHLLYTYTQRQDIAAGTYECFVGSIVSDTEINIKEAGEHCQRYIDPLRHGMKLNKKRLYSCITTDNTIPRPPFGSNPSTPPTITKYTVPPSPTKKTTMKNWNFDNSIPDSNVDETSSSTMPQTVPLLYIIFHIFMLYL